MNLITNLPTPEVVDKQKCQMGDLFIISSTPYIVTTGDGTAQFLHNLYNGHSWTLRGLDLENKYVKDAIQMLKEHYGMRYTLNVQYLGQRNITVTIE